MAKPQGITRMSPEGIVTFCGTAAARSNPAASVVMRTGRGRPSPEGKRFTFTVIGRVARATVTALSAGPGELRERRLCLGTASSWRRRGGRGIVAGGDALGGTYP